MSFVEKDAAERDVVEQNVAKQGVVGTGAASGVHQGETAFQEEQGSFVGCEEATSALKQACPAQRMSPRDVE
jgi:hypothetical protein